MKKVVAPVGRAFQTTGTLDVKLVKEAAIIIVDLQITSRRTLKEKMGISYATIFHIMSVLENLGLFLPGMKAMSVACL